MGNYVRLDNNKVQKLRIIKCWSQDELAAASGVSIRTIQRVEKTGNASLETVKALAAVFDVDPLDLQSADSIELKTFSFIWKYAWLLAFAFSSVFFGLWIVDILIPTLKGADFDQQYELHNNFRYLDFGGMSFFIGFVLLGLNIFVEHTGNRKLLLAAKKTE